MKIKSTSLKMKEGEKIKRYSNRPIISITGEGAHTYIWVGNNAVKDNYCFATISGTKTLEKLACGILYSLGHNANRIKKRIYKKTSI